MADLKVGSIPSRVTMYSGLHVDPLDLQPEDVLVTDIAHHLAMQCRWSGGTKWHYSVGQHAVYCSYLVPAEQAYDALHHDDPEAYLQDMAKPLKNHETLGRAYRVAERKLEKIIGPVLSINYPLSPEVHAADLAMLAAEADQLMHGRSHWTYYQDVTAAAIEIVKWTPEKTKRKFLARHDQLLKGRA